MTSAVPLLCGVLASSGVAAQVSGQASAATANEAVLRQWAQQSGQTGELVQTEQGVQIEWHGQATVETYGASVSGNAPQPLLTPTRSGTHEWVSVGGDLRATSAAGDVTYLQAVGNQSDDRARLSRYNPQMFSFQVGRAGPGYQVAGGDVVASYSGLGANLGLRGLMAVRQIDALTVSGFGGTVAEGWESLLNAGPLNNQFARLTYLRDVYGAKVDYQLSREWQVFSTLQAQRDRQGTVDVAQLPGLAPAITSSAATVGARYQTQWSPDKTLSVSAEWGRSHSEALATGDSSSDDALLIDAQARAGSVGLRLGHHRLGDRWTSVGGAAPAGVRETYGGLDWQLAPGWSWGIDARQTLTRQMLAGAVAQSRLAGLYNRLTWSPADWSGWSFTLSDTRNRSTDPTGAEGANNGWQLNVSRYVVPWTASITVGRTTQQFKAFPLGDSRTSQWQASLGRSWSDATAELPASLTFNLQALLGWQKQVLALPAVNKVTTIGLVASLISGRWGSLNANWQLQDINPENGTPLLRTSQWTLDYTRQLTDQWTLKAYWRNTQQNKGSLLAYSGERVIGVQAGYQW